MQYLNSILSVEGDAQPYKWASYKWVMHSPKMSELTDGRGYWVSTIFFTKKGIHMRNNIILYEVKSEYIKYLGNYQKHIFTQTTGKGKRKYIGIVFEVKGIKYFAPLSSFKDKHKQMKESVDFIKIKDSAIINLNNMIQIN